MNRSGKTSLEGSSQSFEGSSNKRSLEGFIDTHIHTAPDVKPRLLTDIEAAREAAQEKMGAIIIKSHVEPTSGRAQVARELTGFDVFGGVCLNSSVGGLNVEAVKTTASMGGKVVWLPTISRDEIDFTRKENWDKLGDILTVIAENDLILATGHLEVQNIFHVLDLAISIGIKKIIINHPLTRVVGASVDEQKEMSRNAYLEHCYVVCLPGHDGLNPEEIATAIKEVGARRCIMATDMGQKHNPHPISGFKVFTEVMMELGITWKEIELMCRVNPQGLLR
jgi:hypothetical protein